MIPLIADGALGTAPLTERQDHRAGSRVTVVVCELRLHDVAAAREIILAGLAERWGSLDPSKNRDLDDLALSYAGATFLVAEDQGCVVATGALFRSMTATPKSFGCVLQPIAAEPVSVPRSWMRCLRMPGGVAVFVWYSRRLPGGAMRAPSVCRAAFPSRTTIATTPTSSWRCRTMRPHRPMPNSRVQRTVRQLRGRPTADAQSRYTDGGHA